MSNETYEKGLQIRREVIGADYVDEQSADDFSREYHDIVNEHFWGGVWGRPGLSRKQRVLISLSMLAALKRDREFELHLAHALDNGVSTEELKETLIHISAYCGAPTGAAMSAPIAARRQARRCFVSQDASSENGNSRRRTDRRP